MARRRHMPEQIIRKLRDGEKLLGQNFSVEDVRKHLDVDMRTEIGRGTSEPGPSPQSRGGLRDRFGVSERRACRVTGQSRSVQRRPPTVDEIETRLRERLRMISRSHPRWGWCKEHALCRAEGLVVKRKRNQRLWRTEYNNYRPHGSLGFLSPTAFRQQWSPTEFNQPLKLA